MSLDKTLASHLLTAHPAQAAAVLEGLPDQAVLGIFGETSAPVVATTLARVAPLRAAGLLSGVAGDLAQEVVLHLGLDLSADLVRRMEPDRRSSFVECLEPTVAEMLKALIQFPEGTVGSLMDSRVLALPLDVTASDAIEQIRRTPDSIRYNLYVVDREARLVGVLNLRELLLADRDQTLESIARSDVMSIQGHEHRSAILDHPAWREAHSLPVVDREGVYLGAIRYHTLRRLERESTRNRVRQSAHTAEALGELFSTGMEGLLGALTNIGAPIEGPDAED